MLAPISETSDGVGTFRPLGSRCRRFGRDPCSMSRVASLLNFFGLGHGKGESPGFRNTPGDGESAFPVPLYAYNIWMQTGFFCWVVRARFLIFVQSTTLRFCRPATVQPPSSSSLQLYARVAAVVVVDCFDGSVPFVTPPYPIFLLCFRCVRMSAPG